MEHVTELYTPEALTRLERKNRIWAWIVCGFAALALAACVILCAGTTTANAAARELSVIAVSTVCGWIVIALTVNVLLRGRREAAHERNVLVGERQAHTGDVSVTDERVRIRKSITVRTVLLRDGESVRRFHVNEEKARALNGAPERLTVYTVNNYIVGFEAAP